MPKLFIIKICFTIKVNSICGTGQDTWNLHHKLSSQDPARRILGLRVASSKSQGPICRVLGVRVPCPRVPVPRSWVSGSQSPRVLGLSVSGSRASGSWVSGSWGRGLKSQGPGPGSQVLILDYAFPTSFNLLRC